MQNAYDEKKKTRLEILLPHSVPRIECEGNKKVVDKKLKYPET